MGNSQTVSKYFKKEDLQELSKRLNCRTVMHRDGKKFDLYQTSAQNQAQLSNQVQKFKKRKEFFQDDNLNVVKVYEVLPPDQKYYCTTLHNFQVALDHLPYRLNMIPEISDQQALYIGHQALIGYGYISKYLNRDDYQVTPQMIGFNSEDKIKVWLNQRFDCNQPSHLIDLKQVSAGVDHQHQLIDKVFRIVQQLPKSHNQDFMKFRKQYLKQPYRYGESINLIKQYFNRQGGQSDIARFIRNSPNNHYKPHSYPSIRKTIQPTSIQPKKEAERTFIQPNQLIEDSKKQLLFSTERAIFNQPQNFEPARILVQEPPHIVYQQPQRVIMQDPSRILVQQPLRMTPYDPPQRIIKEPLRIVQQLQPQRIYQQPIRRTIQEPTRTGPYILYQDPSIIKGQPIVRLQNRPIQYPVQPMYEFKQPLYEFTHPNRGFAMQPISVVGTNRLVEPSHTGPPTSINNQHLRPFVINNIIPQPNIAEIRKQTTLNHVQIKKGPPAQQSQQYKQAVSVHQSKVDKVIPEELAKRIEQGLKLNMLNQ